jgi:transposase
MAMGTRKQREKQEDIWIAHTALPSSPGHPFYQRLNELLEAEKFDEFVEKRCAKFYAAKYGRPSLTPGIYFRSLLLGYFEGISSEREIAWQLADSLGLRRFVGIGLEENTPDHTTISRTRRLIDVETHGEVFGWVLGVLADRGLVKGKRIAIDATTLEANAAMRSIVRRDTGKSYEEFLRFRVQRGCDADHQQHFTRFGCRRYGPNNYGNESRRRTGQHSRGFRGSDGACQQPE